MIGVKRLRQNNLSSFKKIPIIFVRNTGSPVADGVGELRQLDQPRFNWGDRQGLRIDATQGEVCVLPSHVINLSGGTIYLEFYVDAQFYNGDAKCLFNHGNNTLNQIIIIKNSTGTFSFNIRGPTGTLTSRVTGVTNLSVGWHSCELKWGYDAAVETNVIKAHIDKTYQGLTTINSFPTRHELCTLGLGHYKGYFEYHLNSQIRNVHISDIYRSATESTNGYNPDSHTVLFAPLQNNLYAYQYLNKNSPLINSGPINVSKGAGNLPSVVKSSDGTLYCTFDNTVTSQKMLSKSVDGLNWTTPIVIAAESQRICQDGGILIFNDSNNGDIETLLLVYTSTGATNACDVKSKKSTDGGVTWSEPVTIANNRASDSNPVLLSNGNIIFGSYGYNNGYTNYYLPGTYYAVISGDSGDTWSETLITTDGSYTYPDTAVGNVPNETGVIELKTGGEYTGKVLFLARTFGTGVLKYISTDYGATFAAGAADAGLTEFKNRTRKTIFRVNSSTIAAVTTSNRHLIMMCVSKDEGATWENPFVLGVLPVTNTGAYPCSVILNDGRLITVWGDKNSSTPQVWATITQNFNP